MVFKRLHLGTVSYGTDTMDEIQSHIIQSYAQVWLTSVTLYNTVKTFSVIIVKTEKFHILHKLLSSLCVCLYFVPTAGWHNVKPTVAIDFHASRSFITVMMEWQAGLKCTHDMSDHSLIISPLRTCQSPCPTTCVKLSLTGINKHNVIYCLTCFGVHKAVIAPILSGVLWV